jgi:flagellar basal-body rod protein FlgG
MAPALLPSAAMNVSLFQAASAMNANSRWQEVIAENLASASLPGHRHQEVSFHSLASERFKTSENGSTLAVMSAPRAVASHSFAQGTIRPTDSPTDVAIEGDGFFAVMRDDGSTGYTRDGEFQWDAAGNLVTKQGYQVQGENGAITRNLNNESPFSISNSRDMSQGAEVRGKLKVVEFADVTKLRPAGDGTFEAAEGAQPGDSDSTVRQGFLEGSNTSVVNQMAEMIQAMRSFEANQRVIRVSDERMSRAISQLSPTQ